MLPGKKSHHQCYKPENYDNHCYGKMCHYYNDGTEVIGVTNNFGGGGFKAPLQKLELTTGIIN